MDQYRVIPGRKLRLAEHDPDETTAFDGGKNEGRNRLKQLNSKLEELQERLYAEHQHKVLIVLQAMDTAGKDGTIRHVLEGVNPQGARVVCFKVPSAEEMDHDYLWRVHSQVPRKGEIVIFNRSHYEEVLIVRVHGRSAKGAWSRRYAQINAFEKMLAEEGTTILKFFLNISLEEQKKRLLARLKEPAKQWKYNPGDVDERKFWPEYMQAYEDAISETNTDWAPWYIVPANHKCYRNIVVGSVIVETLKRLSIQTPEVDYNIGKETERVKSL